MPNNNTVSDLKYKLQLRGKEEIQETTFSVAPDNPRGLSADEIADFKTYRAAWASLMATVPDDAQIDVSAEMLIRGITIPDFPEGWLIMTRSVGDLPPIWCRVSELDSYDAEAGHVSGTTDAGGNVIP